MRRRIGYTLIETIVAILIFSAGGLALAAGSAVIARTMAVNGRRESATRLAASRLEQIRSSCEGATNGADSVAGVRVRWNVAQNGGNGGVTSAATVTVTYSTPAGARSETFRVSFACP